jgi:hypothetical protein
MKIIFILLILIDRVRGGGGVRAFSSFACDVCLKQREGAFVCGVYVLVHSRGLLFFYSFIFGAFSLAGLFPFENGCILPERLHPTGSIALTPSAHALHRGLCPLDAPEVCRSLAFKSAMRAANSTSFCRRPLSTKAKITKTIPTAHMKLATAFTTPVLFFLVVVFCLVLATPQGKQLLFRLVSIDCKSPPLLPSIFQLEVFAFLLPSLVMNRTLLHCVLQ